MVLTDTFQQHRWTYKFGLQKDIQYGEIINGVKHKRNNNDRWNKQKLYYMVQF